MKSFNKLPIAILAGIAISGCSSMPTCPFETSGDNCERITIVAYLPPVITDLDYKNIRGSQNQVIVQGGFQHAISVSGQKKAAEQTVTPQLQSLALAPVTDNAILDTETVSFEFDHASIPVSELDKLSNFLRRIDSPSLMHIQVEGHTDSKGSAKYNNKLSIKRARAVCDYLIQHGVQSSKISHKGFGEEFPLEANDTEEHRSKNRRTEIIPLTGS
ncbi:OmpA family protein [Methylobacter tundripaludum]|jgi:outer membrane protein OmpA-like peptidoglycan-associated protein|uniref:OmpA family protein n=1 Tax=Methylobacter tundripaludum TaxID=173365 RepID=UPI000489F566|nr:OmpA family protein [Methylobacter tundripaludum]